MVQTRAQQPPSPGTVLEARLTVAKADKVAKDTKKRGKKKKKKGAQPELNENDGNEAPAATAARKTPRARSAKDFAWSSVVTTSDFH